MAQVLHEHARERLAALSARTELGQALPGSLVSCKPTYPRVPWRRACWA